ncbi:hypothetical protein CALVIDRAFT_455829, partial [Calocera viscosa TUFC12733]
PTITVLYFAAARTCIGLSSERISLPEGGLPLSQLGKLLEERHEDTGLGKVLQRSGWSVNDEMVEEEGVVLRGGEEVGVICPVSGG